MNSLRARDKWGLEFGCLARLLKQLLQRRTSGCGTGLIFSGGHVIRLVNAKGVAVGV